MATKTFSNPGSSTPASHWANPRVQGHSVQFYEDDAVLLAGLSRFIGTAIVSGESALLISTKAHCDGLRERLKESGLDLEVANQQGRLLWLDADETLAKIMVDGRVDRSRFENVAGSLISRLISAAKVESHRVAAFGEMVALLCAQGKTEAALELEQLWNQLAKTHAFQLHCAYPLDLFSQAEDTRALERICAQHTHVAPPERPTNLKRDGERLRTIAVLQHRAETLQTEIRDHKEAEKARRHLAAIVESSDDAIASKDLNGIVTSWNKSAERLFGYTPEEIIGRPITMVIPPELQDDEPKILAKIRAGERIQHFHTVRLHKTGKRIDVSLTISPVRDENGKVVGAAKIVRDITEAKRIEQALHTTEKLAAAGRLAATVAHEINNPLEAVTNLVYLAKRDLPDREKVSRHLELARRELDRVAHIARQTLGFYRDTSKPVRLNVAEVLDGLMVLFESRFQTRKIKVVKQWDENVEITALAGEIRQAFSNLITNAIDVMPAGGSLFIKVSRSRDRRNSALEGVRITVLDTGSGIADEHKKSLFEPFFTTKTSVGTGLGLWITRKIVEQHGGSIRFTNRIGANEPGAAFSIFLPLNRIATGTQAGSAADVVHAL